jgi:murein DD-endopeptidase MepM/ murein hydrolase activator NlpD
MLFTIKRSKSERFFQLRFQGFRPRGRNKIEQYIYILREYFKALLLYFKRKIRQFVRFATFLVLYVSRLARALKAFTVRKLIWSRGRLGKPVINFVVMAAAFIIFLLGEVFNSSKFVNSQEISPDYLASVTDIIPPKNTALTSVPESRRTEPIAYVVEGGDTLYGIGEKFKVSIDAIKYVNSLTDNSVLRPGQEITIPPVSGLIHKVQKGETLQSIAKKYDVPSQAIADFNYILDTSSIALGTELVVPGAKIPEPVYIPPVIPAVIAPPSADPNASSGWCMWPTSVNIITQYFSWYHNGVDIATPWSMTPPLYACGSGTVVRAGWDPWGLGLHVRISHPGGYETTYGHMKEIYVSYGDEVDKGQTIGLMGNTGRSTGPHVHFIIKYNGAPQDPMKYIR